MRGHRLGQVPLLPDGCVGGVHARLVRLLVLDRRPPAVGSWVLRELWGFGSRGELGSSGRERELGAREEGAGRNFYLVTGVGSLG